MSATALPPPSPYSEDTTPLAVKLLVDYADVDGLQADGVWEVESWDAAVEVVQEHENHEDEHWQPDGGIEWEMAPEPEGEHVAMVHGVCNGARTTFYFYINPRT